MKNVSLRKLSRTILDHFISLHVIHAKRIRMDFIFNKLYIIKIKNLSAWNLSHQKKKKIVVHTCYKVEKHL